MFGLSTIVSRIIMGLAVALCVFGFLYVQSCERRKQMAAEGRLKDAQGKAVVESARDAIATQEAVQGRERASEELSQSSAKDIQNVEGAKVRVNPAVHAAGLRSLCVRDAYRDSERCRVFRADPK